MDNRHGYDHIVGTWFCNECGLLNSAERSITSVIRVYEPDVSYHMNVTCERCKTIFTIHLEEEEYLNLMDYDDPLS